MGRFGKFGFPKQLILIFLEHFSDHLALFYFWGVVKDCCAGYPGDLVTLHTSWCLLPGLHNCRLGGLHWIPEGRHLQNSQWLPFSNFPSDLGRFSPQAISWPTFFPPDESESGHQVGPPLEVSHVKYPCSITRRNIQPCATQIFMNKR